MATVASAWAADGARGIVRPVAGPSQERRRNEMFDRLQVGDVVRAWLTINTKPLPNGALIPRLSLNVTAQGP
jgi:hypothetical protein